MSNRLLRTSSLTTRLRKEKTEDQHLNRLQDRMDESLRSLDRQVGVTATLRSSSTGRVVVVLNSDGSIGTRDR